MSAAAHWLLPRENERPYPLIEPRVTRRPQRIVVPQDEPENVIPLAASTSTAEQIILDPAVLTDMVADGGIVRPAAFKDSVVSVSSPQRAASDRLQPESSAPSENYPSSEGEKL